MIEDDCVVAFRFSLKDGEDNILEASQPDHPMVYLHGAGNLVVGLEKGLKGMKVGDKETITVYPEEAFGEVIPELKVKADRSQFPPEIPLEVDRILESDEGGRKQRYRIVATDENMIYLDGNHPMAGKTLHYSVEIVSIRPATEHELEQGRPDRDSHYPL